jgi:translation initiation factor 5
MILGDQGGNGEDDEDEDEDSPYFQLKVWVQGEKGQADAKAVLAKVKELGIEKKHKAVLVLSEWLYTENAVKEVPQYSKLFAAVRLAP